MRTLCVIWALSGLMGASAYDLALNCGGPARTSGGIDFEADRPWDASSGAGYVGGTAVNLGFPAPVGGTATPAPMISSRQGGSFEYRFDLPNGTYRVDLAFCETEVYGAGFRAFDVSVEGVTAVSELDPAGRVGRHYAIELPVRAVVTDGRLDVRVQSILGRALLSSVRVRSLVDPGALPAFPTGLAAHRGYGCTILDWDRSADPAIRGFHVWRSDGGAFERLTELPTPQSRYLDGSAPPDRAATYRVGAVDLFGRVGPSLEVVGSAPLAFGSSPLPECEMKLGEEAMRFLLGDSLRNTSVHGEVSCEGSGWFDARIRHRGNTSRLTGKPSFKIDGRGGDRRKLNLKAESASPSLLQERLAAFLFAGSGVPTPGVEPIHLRMNHRYLGVYHRMEQVDRAFLADRGFGPGTAVWRARSYLLKRPASFSEGLQSYEKAVGSLGAQERVWTLLEELPMVNEGDFDRWFAERFNRESVISFLAAAALTSNGFDGGSYFVLHDPGPDLFSLAPWDLNNASFGQSAFGGAPVIDRPVLRNAMQAFGLNYDRWNLLFTRVLLSPDSRRLLADRIEDLSSEALSPAFARAVSDAHREIRQDAVADPFKLGWEDPSLFLDGPRHIDEYVTGRVAFLASELGSVRDPFTDLVLSEFQVSNRTGVRDELGEHEPWIEIANRGRVTHDLGGLFLTNDLEDRTRWPLPEGTLIPPGGHVVIWADGEPEDGPLHAPFRLESSGGSLGLSDPTLGRTVDALFYGNQMPDRSYGRLESDPDRWAFLESPSPGGPNGSTPFAVSHPPELVHHRPLFPGPDTGVTVTARVGSQNLTGAWVVTPGGLRVAMADDGAHGDGRAGDGRWGALLPPAPAGSLVEYWVEADHGGEILRSPLEAPNQLHSYQVSTHPRPRLHINEVVTRNVTGYRDEVGQTEDWIEIYNGDTRVVDLGGMFLSDNPDKPHKWMFPAKTFLAPGQRLVVFADDEFDGPLHAAFRLKSRGDQVVLTQRVEDGGATVDLVEVPPLAADTAWARCPDGESGRVTLLPSPLAGNVCVQ